MVKISKIGIAWLALSVLNAANFNSSNILNLFSPKELKQISWLNPKDLWISIRNNEIIIFNKKTEKKIS